MINTRGESMHINYDKEKLASVLQDFYNATGINVQFFDENLQTYSFSVTHNRYCGEVHNTDIGKHACRESDATLFDECRRTKETTMHICHAGLVDIAVPILYDDAILGYLILGQMKCDDDFGKVADYLTVLGLNANIMKDYYLSLPRYDSARIQSISNLATMLARHILLNHMMTPDFSSGTQRAIDYIEENIHLPLSMNEIAAGAGISKSTLYKNFSEVFGCTVGDFVMKKRVEKAEKLLLETELSIEEISQQTGFASAAYFTVIFKKHNGIAPLKFRKNNA